MPDDNFEQFLIDAGYDSGPLDDYVPTANINTIIELSITIPADNLIGIEDFIALEKLYLDTPTLVDINLTKNINLKELNIESGDFNNINLTKNIALEVFRLGTASINEIDLTKNINLIDVAIGTNGIRELDLSLNTKLERVEITFGIVENINLKNGNNTNITSFSTEGELSLQCIRVDDVNYSLTNWTNVEDNSVFSETCGSFQQLTYVPDDNFEQELINLGYDSGALDNYVPTNNINTITELLIINKNISDLTGIQDFIALENLQFTQNQVSEVNLSTLTNLKTLYANNNNLNSIDISNNSNISNLYCDYNTISQLDLSSLQNLFELSCGNNPLTSIILPQNNILDGLHVNATLISELDLRNQSNLITHPASFLEIQDNPNLECVFVDDVDFYNSNTWGTITKDTHTTFVVDEAACQALNCSINVDSLNNVTECDSFTLPSLTNGNYYTQSNGNGTQLNSNDIITTSQTIYIYNVDATNASCFNESNFNVTINQTPMVDSLNDITSSENYILTSLENGNYYTESNGNGNLLNVGDSITKSQKIYIYNENSSCFKESSFTVTIETIIQIPSFFTPNNDFLNDTWIVKSNKQIKNIYIYNRFGKLVATPNVIEGWDGTYKGNKKLISSTYWYQIVFIDSTVKIGSVALIRN